MAEKDPLLTIIGEEIEFPLADQVFHAKLPGLRGTLKLIHWFSMVFVETLSSFAEVKQDDMKRSVATGDLTTWVPLLNLIFTRITPEKLGKFLQIIFRLDETNEDDQKRYELLLDELPTSWYLQILLWFLKSGEVEAILGNGKAVAEIARTMFAAVKPPKTEKSGQGSST